MKRIKVLIVEDEWIVSEELKGLLKIEGFDVVGQADCAETALQILNNRQVDVALLDISIKGTIDGIDLAVTITKAYQCAIIFVTALDNNSILQRAKQVRPAAYINKPFHSKNLLLAVELAFSNRLETMEPPVPETYIVSEYIFLKINHRFKRIKLKNILFAEANGSYTHVHTDDVKYTLAINLKAFSKNLKGTEFLRIHRSYIVNLNHIEEYQGNQVYVNGKVIPISLAHKEDLLSRLNFI